MITSTVCRRCSDDKNRRIVYWIKYGDDDYVSERTKRLKEKRSENNKGRQVNSEFELSDITDVESIMGVTSLTSFVCRDGLKTVCPHCGTVMGDWSENK